MKRRFFIFPTALALLSCSVLEDRTVCPCWVRADVSCVDPIKTSRPFDGITISFENAEGFSSRDIVTYADIDSSGMKTYLVPRALTDIVALSGNDGLGHIDGNFIPMDGRSEYPELYSWHKRSDLSGEEFDIAPMPHKQHCVIHLELTEMFRPEKDDLRIRVCGEVAGLNLYTLRPIEGNFEEELAVGPDGRVDIVVPRQYFWHKLTVSVWRDGENLSDTDLSLLMKEAGYDWGKEDLDDISLIMEDFYFMVEMHICPWDSAMEGTVII